MSAHQHDTATQSAADYYDRVAETWDTTHGAVRQNARFARQMQQALKALLSGAAQAPSALARRPHTAARSARGRSHTRPPNRDRRRSQRAAARGSFGVFDAGGSP
jgi:hypothetical protein